MGAIILAVVYLGAMIVNVIYPSGITSGRGYFNYDWITLGVIFIIAVLGAIYLFIWRPDRNVAKHLHDTLEPSGAERAGPATPTT